jgi:hypothetical protein
MSSPRASYRTTVILQDTGKILTLKKQGIEKLTSNQFIYLDLPNRHLLMDIPFTLTQGYCIQSTHLLVDNAYLLICGTRVLCGHVGPQKVAVHRLNLPICSCWMELTLCKESQLCLQKVSLISNS